MASLDAITDQPNALKDPSFLARRPLLQLRTGHLIALVTCTLVFVLEYQDLLCYQVQEHVHACV